MTVQVLPTGAPQGRYNDAAKLKYENLAEAADQIASAHEATFEYFASLDA